MSAPHHYSVGLGPRGGIEYREWSTTDTYRVRSRYQVWPHLSQEQQTWVENKERELRIAKESRSANDQAWRELMRGGSR